MHGLNRSDVERVLTSGPNVRHALAQLYQMKVAYDTLKDDVKTKIGRAHEDISDLIVPTVNGLARALSVCLDDD